MNKFVLFSKQKTNRIVKNYIDFIEAFNKKINIPVKMKPNRVER